MPHTGQPAALHAHNDSDCDPDDRHGQFASQPTTAEDQPRCCLLWLHRRLAARARESANNAISLPSHSHASPPPLLVPLHGLPARLLSLPRPRPLLTAAFPRRRLGPRRRPLASCIPGLLRLLRLRLLPLLKAPTLVALPLCGLPARLGDCAPLAAITTGRQVTFQITIQPQPQLHSPATSLPE